MTSYLYSGQFVNDEMQRSCCEYIFILFVVLAQCWPYTFTEYVYTFKCINTTQVLVISPVSFQSSDWKQLSICFLSYFSWFNYLIKLIFTIKYLFLIILFLFIFIFLFRMVRSQQFFGQNTHTHTHALRQTLTQTRRSTDRQKAGKKWDVLRCQWILNP